MKITSEVLQLTKDFPKENRFDITQQIMRCSISIPSNIAEGSSRKSSKEFAHFISISIGSAFELETQLELSFQLNLVPRNEQLLQELRALQKQMTSFRNQL